MHWPVRKLAASEASSTAAPTSSSGLPKRPMGVRISNSWPRGVPFTRSPFSSVGKTPGAMAFTEIPSRAHSQARLRVNESSADFAAQ